MAYIVLDAPWPSLQTDGDLRGRFVTSPTKPDESFCPSNPETLLQHLFKQDEFLEQNKTLIVSDKRKKSIIAELLAALTLDASSKISDTLRLEAREAKNYWIKQHPDAYTKLLGNELIASWIRERLISGGDAKLYLVTGFLMLRDVKVLRGFEQGAKKGVTGKTPSVVSPILAGASSIPISIDSSISADFEVSHTKYNQAFIKGPVIVGVTCRVVKWREATLDIPRRIFKGEDKRKLTLGGQLNCRAGEMTLGRRAEGGAESEVVFGREESTYSLIDHLDFDELKEQDMW